MKYLFLILCLLGMSTTLLAQKYSFINYSLKEGLPQSQITSIEEDENGYLWIGTLGGLSRFNGSKFSNYSTIDGLLNNRITSINYYNKQVWIGHHDGISCFEKNKFKKWSFPKRMSNVNVTGIVELNNVCFIATNGNGLFEFDGRGNFKQITLGSEDSNRIRAIRIMGGKIYLATRGGLYAYDVENGINLVAKSQHLNISGLYVDQDKIYITTFNSGTYTYSTKVRSGIQQLNDLTGLRNPVLDKNGNFWAISDDGIQIIQRNGTIKTLTERTGLDTKLPSYIYEDINGTIWIGSEGKGLFKFPGIHFSYFDSKTALKTDLVTSIQQLDATNYLIGTYDYGIQLYNEKKGFKQISKLNEIIWDIQKIDAHTALISSNDGLYTLNTDNYKLTPIKHEETNLSTYSILKFKDVIYIGTSVNLYRYEKGELKRVLQKKDKHYGEIRSLCAFDGKLFIGAETGLYYLENDKLVNKNANIKNILCMTKTNNQLWIGTEDGLFRFVGDRCNKYFLSSSTGANYVNFLNKDDENLYVGTNDGFFRVSINKNTDKSNIYHYGIEEGLINLETNINSSFISRSGILMFGTAEGLVFYDKKNDFIDYYERTPLLNIAALKLNYQTFNYENYSKHIDDNGLPTNLKIPISKNNLIIELDGTILSSAKNLKYRYKLEGYNDDWVPEFNTSQISLTNIPAGSYRLLIQAMNGTYYSKPYELDLIVTPAFYNTWWFYTLAISVIVGGALLLFVVKLRNEQQKSLQERLELNSKLLTLEQQSLNASMNRHFIFNSLNSIQYYINTQDKQAANKYLSEFAKLIRKNLDSGSSSNNLVSLEDEIERIKLYLSLEKMRFQGKFDYEIIFDDIDIENTLIPSMIFQAFVENSIMHGILPKNTNDGLIKIKIEEKNSTIEISIEDNGVGIDFSRSLKKNQVRDHISQGVSITSKRMDVLKEISNKGYELFGPVQLYNEDNTIKGTMVLLKFPIEY